MCVQCTPHYAFRKSDDRDGCASKRCNALASVPITSLIVRSYPRPREGTDEERSDSVCAQDAPIFPFRSGSRFLSPQCKLVVQPARQTRGTRESEAEKMCDRQHSRTLHANRWALTLRRVPTMRRPVQRFLGESAPSLQRQEVRASAAPALSGTKNEKTNVRMLLRCCCCC